MPISLKERLALLDLGCLTTSQVIERAGELPAQLLYTETPEAASLLSRVKEMGFDKDLTSQAALFYQTELYGLHSRLGFEVEPLDKTFGLCIGRFLAARHALMSIAHPSAELRLRFVAPVGADNGSRFHPCLILGGTTHEADILAGLPMDIQDAFLEIRMETPRAMRMMKNGLERLGFEPLRPWMTTTTWIRKPYTSQTPYKPLWGK